MTQITNANFIGKKVAFVRTIQKAFDISLKDARAIADNFPMSKEETLTFIHYNWISDEHAFRQIGVLGQPTESDVSEEEEENLIISVQEIVKKAVDKGDYNLSRYLLSALQNYKGD